MKLNKGNLEKLGADPGAKAPIKGGTSTGAGVMAKDGGGGAKYSPISLSLSSSCRSSASENENKKRVATDKRLEEAQEVLKVLLDKRMKTDSQD
jgi:hypothetical protein